MTESLHVQVSPLAAYDGWLLRCTEYPEVVIHTPTLDDMGRKVAQAVADATGRPDTIGMAISFDYPRGEIDLYQITREPDDTFTCSQVPEWRVSGDSRISDLVQSIALATGTSPDTVGIALEPF